MLYSQEEFQGQYGEHIDLRFSKNKKILNLLFDDSNSGSFDNWDLFLEEKRSF